MDAEVSARIPFPGVEGGIYTRVTSDRGGRIRVTLSRRNLVSLLSKLDGHPPDSAVQIEREVDSGWTLIVHGEEDAEHYDDRPDPAGPMHPDTEKALQEEEK